MIKNIKKSVIFGGVILGSMAVAGYRTYQAHKLRKLEEEQEIIDISPETLQESDDTQK